MTDGRPLGWRQADRLALGLVLGWLGLAQWVRGDYGITWDETAELYWVFQGENAWNFWFGGGGADAARFDTGHNPFKHFVYHAAWRALNAVGLAFPKVEVYHALTAVVAAFGLWLGYRVLRRFVSPVWAIGGLVLLMVTPRLVGHSFGNFKDLPFAVMWLACLLTLLPIVERPDWKGVLLHGLAFAGLIVVRVGGLMFLPLSGLGLLYGAWQAQRDGRAPQWGQRIGRGTVALLLALVLHQLSYPYLLVHPVDGLVELFETQRNFLWEGQVLVLGQLFGADAVPRWYGPIWLLVTLPEMTLLGLIVALGLWARRRELRIEMLLLVLSALWPLGYVVAARAQIYDGVRHLLFILAPLSILATVGWARLAARFGHKPAMVGFGIGLMWMVVQLVLLHPFQTAYFNQLTGGIAGAQGRFTLDYWGASARQAGRILREKRESGTVCVLVEIEGTFEYEVPGWGVVRAETLAGCDASATHAYVFSMNRAVQDAEAYATERPDQWRIDTRIQRDGATIGTIFRNPAPVSP